MNSKREAQESHSVMRNRMAVDRIKMEMAAEERPMDPSWHACSIATTDCIMARRGRNISCCRRHIGLH